MKPMIWSGMRVTALAVLSCAGVQGWGQVFTGSVSWESQNAGFVNPDGQALTFAGSVAVDVRTSPARNWATLRAESGPGLLRSTVDVGLGGLLVGEALTPSSDGGPFRSVGGQAYARFTDTLTVTPSQPGLFAAEGKVRFRVEVNGGMGVEVASHTGQASAGWFLEGSEAFVADPVRAEQMMPTFDLPSSGLLDYDLFDGDGYASSHVAGGGQVESGVSYSDSGGSTIVFDLPVYFGSPFDIGLGLRTTAGVSLSPVIGNEDTLVGSGYALADYGNTARLSVEGVFDAAGVPLGVAEYQFNSASGHGYGLAAVPEPREWSLMTGMLLPLGWWLRRRRGQRRVGGVAGE